jgi:hypothetical protein
MSVQVVQSGGGGGLFGGLGTLLSVGGTLLGVPMLGTIGAGMNAVDALSSGDPAAMAQAALGMQENGMLGNWQNPAQGNLYMPGGAETGMLWDPKWGKALEGKGVTGF